MWVTVQHNPRGPFSSPHPWNGCGETLTPLVYSTFAYANSGSCPLSFDVAEVCVCSNFHTAVRQLFYLEYLMPWTDGKFPSLSLFEKFPPIITSNTFLSYFFGTSNSKRSAFFYPLESITNVCPQGGGSADRHHRGLGHRAVQRRHPPHGYPPGCPFCAVLGLKNTRKVCLWKASRSFPKKKV